ncbi:MAG: DUF47 family protein [Proteobacteria bacterium]|nr:DUF47 family protein [Pseudomonadota bacterium]
MSEKQLLVVAHVPSANTRRLAEAVLRKLFAMEDQLGVGTVFWYQLVNWIGDIADYAERVGNRLRLLIAS